MSPTTKIIFGAWAIVVAIGTYSAMSCFAVKPEEQLTVGIACAALGICGGMLLGTWRGSKDE